jgi:trehalose/maltose hydrolase-like predicted phosphorylase
MMPLLEPTQNPGWVLNHDGYNVLTESALESRFAFGNGFLGMRAARSVSRGPTWVAWLGYSRWASWPRCHVAGLFDVPNIEPPVPALVPIADWSRVRILLDGEPLLAREGEIRNATRKLDLRRGLLLSTWTHRTRVWVTQPWLCATSVRPQLRTCTSIQTAPVACASPVWARYGRP